MFGGVWVMKFIGFETTKTFWLMEMFLTACLICCTAPRHHSLKLQRCPGPSPARRSSIWPMSLLTHSWRNILQPWSCSTLHVSMLLLDLVLEWLLNLKVVKGLENTVNLMLFQIHMTFIYSVGYTKFCVHTIKVNDIHCRFGLHWLSLYGQKQLKLCYLLLSSTEKRKFYRFGMTWGWI